MVFSSLTVSYEQEKINLLHKIQYNRLISVAFKCSFPFSIALALTNYTMCNSKPLKQRQTIRCQIAVSSNYTVEYRTERWNATEIDSIVYFGIILISYVRKTLYPSDFSMHCAGVG